MYIYINRYRHTYVHDFVYGYDFRNDKKQVFIYRCLKIIIIILINIIIKTIIYCNYNNVYIGVFWYVLAKLFYDAKFCCCFFLSALSCPVNYFA